MTPDSVNAVFKMNRQHKVCTTMNDLFFCHVQAAQLEWNVPLYSLPPIVTCDMANWMEVIFKVERIDLLRNAHNTFVVLNILG